MKRPATWTALAVAVCTGTTLMAGAGELVAISATRSDAFEFGVLLNFYYATVDGTINFYKGKPYGISIDANDILSNPKSGVFGTLEARKGKWGMFADFMYVDDGQFQSHYQNPRLVPIWLSNATTEAHLDVKSVAWTLAGTYWMTAAPGGYIDLIAGVRLLDTQQSMDWKTSGTFHNIPVMGLGSFASKDRYVDGVAGIKGRAVLRRTPHWFVPYYGDIGTGESKMTWQLGAGVGYASNCGEIVASYRFVDYQFKSSSANDTLRYSGPMLGIAFRCW